MSAVRLNVLITGAEGQLGTSLVETVPGGFALFAAARADLDICNAAAVARMFSELHPHVVINAAAYTAVDRAEWDREAAFRVNAEGPGVLARACYEGGCRLVHVSTDYVFDGAASRPYPPEHPRSPLNAYGESKAAGEEAVLDMLPEATIVRSAWVYSRHKGNFVSTMRSLIAERNQVEVVSDQVGTPTWTENLARVLWAFVARPVPGIFHYTDAGVASWYDFAVAIAEEGEAAGVLLPRARIEPVTTDVFPRPAPRPPYTVLDCGATHAHTGLAPEHWRRALRRMFASLPPRVRL